MKNDLPYFTHNNNARRHPKMKALIAELGFEGYGRFWALCERIAEDSDAYLDISKKVNKLDLASELGLDGNGLDTFLSFLADPEIDLINLANGVITIDRITELFEETMGKRAVWRHKKKGGKNAADNAEGKNNIPHGKDDFPEGNDDKQEKKREKETRENFSGSSEPPSPATISDLETVQPPDETPPDKKTGKPQKPPLREREPENDQERVLKAYGLNWDRLYAEGKVKDSEPPENWGLARKRLKQCLERLPPERIIEAIDRGLHDDKAMEGGYSLSGMLVDWLFSRLLNGSTGPPSGNRHRIASDEVSGDGWEKRFARDDLDGFL